MIALGSTLTAYWPWWVGLGWLLGYELYAALTHRPTLSQLVWRAQARFPPLRWIALPLIGLLVAHFWFGLWR